MRTNRLLLLLGIGLLSTSALAQAPQGFSYQAVARDQFGNAVNGQTIGVQFVLHQGNALGAVVYAETHSASTNANGLFALTVGGGSTSTGTFSSIDWSNGPYFLEVAMDLNSSGSYTPLGTQQLMSVPYALYAGKSNVPDGTEVGQVLRWNGNAWVTEPGLYAQGKRFGMGGETSPESPLGIKGEAGQDDRMISFTSNDATRKWNINLNPTVDDVSGFSIDDASTGVGTSRLFIAPVSGNVGLGTADPDAALTIRSSTPLKQHFMTGDIPTQDDFWDVIDSRGLSMGQGNPDTSHIHLTLQSITGHLGLGTDDPQAPLAIKSREILKTYFETGDVPTQDQFGFTSDGSGFGIGQGAPDALTSRLFIQALDGHIGIGTDDPPAPLAIKSRSVLKTFFETGDVPAQSDFGFTSDTTGFGIEQGTPSSLTSRFFIDSNDGNVGVGTVTPTQKLHVSGANDGGAIGLQLTNTAASADGGWLMSVIDDNAVAERMKTFAVHEKTGADLTERFTVLPGGNVGINEPLPDVKLHVSRPVDEPGAAVDLIEGTGIVVVGPMTNNIVADYRGIQARHGEYAGGGTTMSLTASELNLQRLGGNILIHGDDATAPPNKGIITEDARLGLGTTTPMEKIDIDGAVKIGTSLGDNDGTIRYNGTDFQGRAQGSWRSLGSEWQKVDNTDAIYYNPSSTPRVGIGTNTPDATLQVRGNETCDEGFSAATLGNSSVTLSTSSSATRVGLGISCTGPWSANADAKNIGLYISNVSGQSEASSNIAAVINGNVVVGDITGQQIGTGGTNVLAIQNGAAPAASSGAPIAGIQIYSSELGVGGPSVLHVMTGDGAVIKLYRSPAMTPADGSTVGGTYDPTTGALIENMRTRINELETILKSIGLLTP